MVKKGGIAPFITASGMEELLLVRKISYILILSVNQNTRGLYSLNQRLAMH
jgi:hypothetical protein